MKVLALIVADVIALGDLGDRDAIGAVSPGVIVGDPLAVGVGLGVVHVALQVGAEPLRAEIEDFVESVRAGRAPFACPQQARDVVWLLEQGELALKKSRG